MTSRLKYLLLAGALGLACRSEVGPPSPPPSPPPPPPPNHAPVAVIGGPYASDSGLVQFDGSASSDSDGDPLTFAWNFGDGGTSTDKKPTHNYAGDSVYHVSLVVKDTKGASSDTARTTATIEHAVIFMGAGNIASCGNRQNAAATARLIDSVPNAHVFTTGDNAFPEGTDSEYASCYGPTWGQFLNRTRPTLGNHDYQTGNADGSFHYFGAQLGDGNLGYYSYDLGAWHIIVLNDQGNSAPFLDPASPQGQWLANDLATHTNTCTAALWHIPLFNSSNTPGWTSSPDHRMVWQTLYAAGVDIVLNGQQHNYERFAPMTPDGAVDSARGIVEFNVGTGGESVEDFTVSIHPHSETRAAVFGVLKLTLKHGGYDWQFVPVAGATYSDSGSGTCH